VRDAGQLRVEWASRRWGGATICDAGCSRSWWRELWQPLHWRHQRQVCRPLSNRRRGTGVRHRCFDLLRACRSRQTLRCCCSHWPAHDERGGKLLQHRVERDDPCGRFHACTQRQCQWIWLKEAKCSSGRSGVVGKRAPADVPRRLTPAASASAGAVGAVHGPMRGPIQAWWTTVWHLGGRRVATSRVPWQVGTRRRRLRRPMPLAVPGEVAVAVTAQATFWQPASCDVVVGLSSSSDLSPDSSPSSSAH